LKNGSRMAKRDTGK